MHTPTTTARPGGVLEQILGHWETQGWSLDDLARFRMGPDDDPFDGMSVDEVAAVQALTADDIAKLSKLTPEQLADLDPEDDDEEDDLPEKVKGVLAKERGTARAATKAKKAADRKARDEKARADRLQEELDRLKKGGKPDDPPVVDHEKVRRDAEDAAAKKANQRIVRAEVKAAAAGKFADPELAIRLVDLDSIDVDDDGDVDTDAIVAELDEILSKNPGLAAKAKRTKPKPTPGQGSTGAPATGADAGRSEAERRFGKKKVGAST